MVRQRKKQSMPKSLWVVLVVALMGELMTYGWCRVQCRRVGYEIAEARAVHNRLKTAANELKIEEALLRSPKRIRKIAQTRGLSMPAPEQVLMIP